MPPTRSTSPRSAVMARRHTGSPRDDHQIWRLFDSANRYCSMRPNQLRGKEARQCRSGRMLCSPVCLRAFCTKRVAPDEAWDNEFANGIRGTPCKPALGKMATEILAYIDVSDDCASEEEGEKVVAHDPIIDEMQVEPNYESDKANAAVHVTKDGPETCGQFDHWKCADCKAMRKEYARPLVRSSECRSRIVKHFWIVGDPVGRVQVATNKVIETEGGCSPLSPATGRIVKIALGLLDDHPLACRMPSANLCIHMYIEKLVCPIHTLSRCLRGGGQTSECRIRLTQLDLMHVCHELLNFQPGGESTSRALYEPTRTTPNWRGPRRPPLRKRRNNQTIL